MGEERDYPDLDALTSPAAMGALSGASRAEADALLRKQRALLDLQIDNLGKIDAFEMSHLRWRRFNDQMRGALQIMAVAIGAVVVVAIGAAMWNASEADGLVVEPFSVPPPFEQRGLGGDVVAGDVTAKIAQVRATANANSYSLSRDVTNDHSNEIKVEIPDTGISIAEAWRYLRNWLGHERHLTGNLRDNADGTITLATSLDGAGQISASGRAADLPALEQRVAEGNFAVFDPVNTVNYLTASGRHREAYAAAQRYVSVARTRLERADSYALLAYTGANVTGDLEKAVARARIGIAIDPTLAVAHVMAARYSFMLGHDEDAIAEDRTILSLGNADQPLAHQNGGFDEMRRQAAARVALLEGDFAQSVNWNCGRSCTLANTLLSGSEAAAQAHDVAAANALLTQGLAATNPDRERADTARLAIAAEAGDWAAAIANGKDAWAAATAPDADLSPRFLQQDAAVRLAPALAGAEAHAGRFAEAHAMIDKTPGDCVLCDTARGGIDDLEGNSKGAAFWFARAIHEGPSIPFAYVDWGEMLLRKGDLDGAIGKFDAAHQKGSRFADPLELWGEALIAKNRSDLALAKFAEANQYAPNWGRLHLKWGEALRYAGQPDEANRQFALAAGLWLTAEERAALARGTAPHG